jgi:hypothetical protein
MLKGERWLRGIYKSILLNSIPLIILHSIGIYASAVLLRIFWKNLVYN